ncbi:MAG: serine hydrolase domain-containing protein [Kofleriaceae bacterium]
MRSLAFAALLVACGSSTKPAMKPELDPVAETVPPPAPPAPKPLVEKTLTDDTPSKDADGNSFVAPKGWKVGTRDALTVLTPPEGGSSISLFDTAAATADDAVTAAWKAIAVDFKRPVDQSQDLPDRDGWTKGKVFSYRTSPAEKRAIQAIALQANGRWLVMVVDFELGLAQKRGGELGVVFGKLMPKGAAAESFAGKTPNALDAKRLADLHAFVEKTAALLKIPGVAYGIVQNGKVVFSGGIGTRKLGGKQDVDGKTLFMIASATKPLTTLLLAKLVDQKKLSWEQPVTQVMPTFRLGDADVTKQVLVKHLVCACTGLPRTDLQFLLQWKAWTPETTIKTLGSLTPTSKFGELFQYSNLMAAAGGFTAGHVLFPTVELGAAYDKAMQQQVLDPLGMKATTFDMKKGLAAANHAVPHALDLDGNPVIAPMDENYSVAPVRPADGAWSNVDDLLKYVTMELAQGKGYIGADALLARRVPTVKTGADGAYGMGLYVDKVAGIEIDSHDGDLIGYHSDVLWLPDMAVGMVILSNGDLGPTLRTGMRRKLLELLFDAKPEADTNMASAAKLELDGIAKLKSHVTNPAEADLAKSLAAAYHNDELGDIAVTHPGNATVFDFGEFKSEVATLKNPDGTVSFVLVTPGTFLGMAFVAGTKDSKQTLIVRDGQHEYAFISK